MTAQQVSDFVNQSWQGIYRTYKSRQYADGQLWVTELLVPDGPKVFTLEKEDGTLEDVTRPASC